MSRKSPLLVLCAVLLVLAAACSPRKLTVKATLDLYEFVNPALEKQLAQIADSCFSDDDAFRLSIFPPRTLYADLPDIDPEQGTPCNALFGVRDYCYPSDSAFFSQITSCVKIGKRLCFLEDTLPGIFRRTGRHTSIEHTFNTDEVRSISEEDRYLLLGSDALVQRVFPSDCFVPDGPIDSILFIIPDTLPRFPGGNDALSRWVARHAQWPDSIQRVYATFTVERDGTVSDIQPPQTIKNPSERAYVESLRPLIPSMPRWTPGKAYGRTVRSNILIRLKHPS